MLDLEGKNISDQKKNYASKVNKISPFIYKKLGDHDRIPLYNLKNEDSPIVKRVPS